MTADADDIFNEFYIATDDCSSKASMLFNAPQKCVVKESMNNQQICGKLRWYCDDSNAQSMLDMTSHVCSQETWTTRACCNNNPNSNCDREILLQEGSDISDFWYVVKQECKSTDFDLVERETATTVSSTTTTTTTTKAVTTQSSTTPSNGDTYCGSNLKADNAEICGALDWHCNVS